MPKLIIIPFEALKQIRELFLIHFDPIPDSIEHVLHTIAVSLPCFFELVARY